MTTKVVTILKYVGLFTFVFFTIISCEKEIEGIGVDIIGNTKFSTGTFTSEVDTGNENVDRVPANRISQYLLGVYADNEFGSVKGSIVSQLLLPSVGDNYDYGTNAAIDSVIIFIPYQSTKQEDATDGKPVFEIDSVMGNNEVQFKLSIYELETFLNTLDPEDPSKEMVYYSDKVFEKSSTAFYSDNFKINPNDTVAYIKRYMPDGITVYDTDTIKTTTASPSIKLALNEAMIQQIFVDNASGPEFGSIDAFTHYFRGFYIEATELATNKSHLISLNMVTPRMAIYYSNDQDEATDVDLNGNGVTGETGVRIKKTYDFVFGPNKSNFLERDYTISKESGLDRLYVQGAAGSIATVDLFSELSEEEFEDLRNNELLITNATLTFYVDQNASSNIVPEQLFIYNFEENLQIVDMMTEGLSGINGRLERDEDGNPYKYIFNISRHLSTLLNSNEPTDLVTLGIKIYNPSDSPQSLGDTTIKDFSWIAQGVVLFDQSESSGDKKVQLDIKYSEIK